MIKKKKAALVIPTLEERTASANAHAANALFAFENAALALESAADDLDAVRDEAHDEAQRHLSIKVDADLQAGPARVTAMKIRDLVSGE